MVKKNIKYLIIFLIILFFNLIIFPVDLDEIWCYGFSHNIYSGLFPYKDFNMVITPFYPFLMALPFFIFGSNILVFHVFQAVLITWCCKLLFDLIGDRMWFLITFFFFPASCFWPGYNLFLLFLLISIIWFEKESDYKYKDYIIGFIIGLCILTKQSVGVFLIIPSLFYIKDKDLILKRCIGLLIPCIVFIFYLIFSNSFIQFLDLCFFGLFDFASDNGNTLSVWFILTIVVAAITIYFMIRDRKEIVYCYALCFYSMAIPLFDVSHFQVLFIIFLFCLAYCKNIDVKLNYMLFMIGSVVCISAFLFVINYNSNIIYPNDLSHFQYRVISSGDLSITKKVNKYINKNKDKDFMFLDSNGYYFKIINDVPITYTDMLNMGNWGHDGSKKLLTSVKKMKEALFFVNPNELKSGNQSDKAVIRYVIEHGKKIDSVSVYDIYVLNN